MLHERHAPRLAIAYLHVQAVVHKIEVDLEHAIVIGNRTGGEAAGSEVLRDVPGMIDPRRLREPYFSHDLATQLQARTGLAPLIIR